MFKNLKLNSTMLEVKNSKVSWKPYAICYLIYAAIMSISVPLFLYAFYFDKISATLSAYFLATFICVGYMILFAKSSLKSLGMEKSKVGKNFGLGWLYAIAILGLTWLLNMATGAISVAINNDFKLLIFLLLLLGFTVQSFMEEFLFRGLIFTGISARVGVTTGLLFNSLLFALGHAGNASASPLSVINTFLIAVLFSLVYYYHDNLWIVAGFHAAWNFLLGPVLGIIVSGFDMPTYWLKTTISDKLQFLNGGAYGFEASSLTTLFILLFIACYLNLIRKSSSVKQKPVN